MNNPTPAQEAAARELCRPIADVIMYGTRENPGFMETRTIFPSTIHEAYVPVVADLIAERDALAKFKAYVHQRLDEAGVPVDPDSPHKAAGCRIGGRLDFVLAERNAARAERDTFKKSLETIECGAFNGADVARAALRGDFKPVVKVSTP